MKAEPFRSQLLFSSFIFANEVVTRCHFRQLLSFHLNLDQYCITLTPDKSVVSWDDNTAVVYSKEQHWQGRLFHQPNCPQAWMKIHCLPGMFGEVVKVSLQRVDLRARQSCFVVIELLSQLRKILRELYSLGSQTQDRQVFIRSATLL